MDDDIKACIAIAHETDTLVVAWQNLTHDQRRALYDDPTYKMVAAGLYRLAERMSKKAVDTTSESVVR